MDAWRVPGTVVKVVDGDTVLVELDLGWHVRLVSAVRVDGIDAPEKNTPAGRAAKEFAETLLPAGTPVTVVSKKMLGAFEKYGRVLADIHMPAPEHHFALAMVAAGHAQPRRGRTEKP